MTGEELYARWCEGIDAATEKDDPVRDDLRPWALLTGHLKLAWMHAANHLPVLVPEEPDEPPPAKQHTLYRFLDVEDQLLYVGRTINPGLRLDAHRRDKSWWCDVERITIEKFDNHEELVAAEREAIQTEGPLHNKRGVTA